MAFPAAKFMSSYGRRAMPQNAQETTRRLEPPTVSSGRKRNADQGGQRLGSDFMHDRGAMIVHRPLADFQVARDVLARAARQNHIEDFALAGCEGFDFRSRNCSVRGLLRATAGVIQSLLN